MQAFVVFPPAVIKAVRRDKKKKLKKLVKKHGESLLFCSSISGDTLLMIAARYGSIKVAKYLLDQGVFVECCDEAEWQPVHEASARGDLEMIALLCKYGARVTDLTYDMQDSVDLADPRIEEDVAEMAADEYWAEGDDEDWEIDF